MTPVILTPASGGSDLLSLDAAKRYLEIDAEETDKDELLADLIAGASKSIRTFTGRRFTTPIETASRTFYLSDSRFLEASRSDELVRIDAIADENGDALVEGDGFEIEDVTSLGFLVVRFSRRLARVGVTGGFGWASIPEDVVEAARRAVAVAYQRDVANLTKTFTPEGGTEAAGLPSSARDLLEAYRLEVGGGLA